MGVWPPFSIISPPKVDRQGDMRSVTVSSLDRLAGADYDMLIQFLRVNELYVVKSRGKKKKSGAEIPCRTDSHHPICMSVLAPFFAGHATKTRAIQVRSPRYQTTGIGRHLYRGKKRAQHGFRPPSSHTTHTHTLSCFGWEASGLELNWTGVWQTSVDRS